MLLVLTQYLPIAMDSFIESCEHFDTYPQNLLEPESLPHTLRAHSNRLRSHENRLFHEEQAAVDFWDWIKEDHSEGYLLLTDNSY
jgi:hypothetical protein